MVAFKIVAITAFGDIDDDNLVTVDDDNSVNSGVQTSTMLS